MRVRTLALLALAFAIPLAAGPALATHWCGQTTFSLTPDPTPAGKLTTFSLIVGNTGIDTTELQHVNVKFSWEGTWREVGNSTILAGQGHTFTFQATPPSPGAYGLEINASGTSSGDVLREISECHEAEHINASQAQPGFEFVGAVAAGAVAALVARHGMGRKPEL